MGGETFGLLLVSADSTRLLAQGFKDRGVKCVLGREVSGLLSSWDVELLCFFLCFFLWSVAGLDNFLFGSVDEP